MYFGILRGSPFLSILLQLCSAIAHPFHPTCFNCQQGPSSSCFPSPLSPLWWHHPHIVLALPVLVLHHHPLVLPSSTLLMYPHRRHHHRRRNTQISLPLLPTSAPCIGSILSCPPCWRWCRRGNSKPLALTALMPMTSLHVLLLPPPPNAAAAIFNCRPMPPPNAAATQQFSNATAAPLPSSNAISSWLLCVVFVLSKIRVHFIAPCDCKFSQKRAVNNRAYWQGF